MPKSFNSRLKYWAVAGLLVAATLACATNTPVAQRSDPRPTRTPLPTFTRTPLPPTATPVPSATPTPPVTDTPLPTDTPIPPTETPIPTDTVVPPTDTPVPPPPTPVPPTPVPPTDTPVPVPPTPVPAPVSPVGTPTFTPVPGSPEGSYEPREIKTRSDCANLGVIGNVRNGSDSDSPRMPGVTIKVTGDEDGFRGPYYGTTNGDGEYVIVIGEYGSVPTRVEFKAEVFGGDNVKTKNAPEWSFSDDCHSSDANQVMEIKWER
jgi:hypothetical protein